MTCSCRILPSIPLLLFVLAVFVQEAAGLTNVPASSFSPPTQDRQHAPLLANSNQVRSDRPTISLGIPGFSILNRNKIAYQVQKVMTGTLMQQLGGILFAGFTFTVVGATLLSLAGGSSEAGSPKDILKQSYILMNRVPGWVFHGDRFQNLVRHCLFMSNVITLSLITGIFAATVKTWVDKTLNGNDAIFEKHHILILSDLWHSQIIPVVKALERSSGQAGSEDVRGYPIVIMTPLDRAASIKKLADNLQGKMRVIVRSGDPMSMHDLNKVCVKDAKKVLFLKADDAKPAALRRRVAMQTSILRNLRPPAAKEPVAVLGTPTFKGQEKHEKDFAIVEEQEFVGRLLALCTVPSNGGLAQVYNEVLQEEVGAELYVSAEVCTAFSPFLLGKNFKDLGRLFDRSVPCGLVRKGRAMLAPDEAVVEEGDKLVVFAPDPSKTKPSRKVPQPLVKVPDMPAGEDTFGDLYKERKKVKRKVLVLNWNERAEKTIAEINEVGGKNCPVTVLGTQGKTPGATCFVGDSLDPAALKEAGAIGTSSILVLSDSKSASNTSPQTDTELLATVEALGEMAWGEHPKPRIIGTVFSSAAAAIIAKRCEELGFDHELILSDVLEAGALSQVLLRPELEEVFNELLSADTPCNLQLRPLPSALPASFSSLRLSLRQLQSLSSAQNQVILGIVQSKGNHQHSVILNPRANKALTLSPTDRLIVIAARAPR
eukprot:CAMPEP_0181311176 /NCGR_PEP_ID=MMETSP1101-20121128/12992_1 /TAXON_ID=46948 /ORGANISM="Rhodomonas abbreviata, Strain Caron Lab Isolate" /LENGTH=713 /DNA_ID=CAMNT_0023417879 /DNA_START=71 /DNA_END=2212 /DNA_ORIENTATION=+